MRVMTEPTETTPLDLVTTFPVKPQQVSEDFINALASSGARDSLVAALRKERSSKTMRAVVSSRPMAKIPTHAEHMQLLKRAALQARKEGRRLSYRFRLEYKHPDDQLETWTLDEEYVARDTEALDGDAKKVAAMVGVVEKITSHILRGHVIRIVSCDTGAVITQSDVEED